MLTLVYKRLRKVGNVVPLPVFSLGHRLKARSRHEIKLYNPYAL